MSNELPGITQDHFLSGLPFYNQLQPYFTYRFSADNRSGTTGILIPDQASNERRNVSNIHSKGFTLTVFNKPVNIEFKKCHSLDALLTKDDFLSEKLFKYSGNFTHMLDKPLRFNRKLNQVMDEKDREPWAMHSVNDTSFAVFKKQYGMIGIYYKECRLIDHP